MFRRIRSPLRSTSITVLATGSGYTAATVGFIGGCTTEPVATATVGVYDGSVRADDYWRHHGNHPDSVPARRAPPIRPSPSQVTALGAAAFASVATLSQQDPTWDSALWGGYGNLWYPHVYMTNQWPGNPDGSGVNPMGRWDYASWFWPPFNGTSQYTVRGELPCPTAYDATMTCPGIPSALAACSDDRGRWVDSTPGRRAARYRSLLKVSWIRRSSMAFPIRR